MALVLVPLFVAILAGAAVVLIPGLEQKISADIADINGSFVRGVTAPIIQAWMVVAGISAALGLAIWFTEFEIGKRTGQQIALPEVQPLTVPAAPTFGASSGLRAGPFTSGIQAGSGQAPPQVVYTEPRQTLAQQYATVRQAQSPAQRAQADAEAAKAQAKAQADAAKAAARATRKRGSLRATVKS